MQNLMRNAFILGCLWLFSAVAFSNGSSIPEMKVIDQERSSLEFPLLKELHDITLELQILELAIKNRRNQRIESKMTEATTFIQQRGHTLESQLQLLRQRQTGQLADLLQFAKRYAANIHIDEPSFDEATRVLMTGQIREGTLSVFHAGSNTANVIANLTPLRVGAQYVWQVTAPDNTPQSFWDTLRSLRRSAGVANGALSADNLKRRLKQINESHREAMDLIQAYQEECHQKLYAAFEDHRYGLFQRLAAAHRSLLTLSRANTAMGTPEEIGALYNQVLQQFMTYGIDVSLATERDFSIQGFLFAPSQQEAQRPFERMRFTPTAATYNSPSS